MDSNGSIGIIVSMVSFLNDTPSNNTQVKDEFTPLVSDLTVFYFHLAFHVIMCGLVSIAGIIANTINIIVFVRMGVFTESGSASLLGLAVSDLCSVTSMLWFSCTIAIVLVDPPGLSFKPWDLMYLTGGWTTVMFAQITRIVTAYLSLERCICVVFPFKVKFIFTPRRSLTAIAAIFICFALSYSPVFIKQRLEFKFDSATNATRLILVFSSDWYMFVRVTYYVNSVTFNNGSVLSVLVCTMITISRVNLSKAWRKSTNQTGIVTGKEEKNQTSKKETNSNPNLMSNSKMQKEKKLVRIITLISVIFLICFIPDIIYIFMTTIDPDITVPGKEQNIGEVVLSFTFLFGTISSAINIIVYYKMSSRYNQVFRALFGLKTD